MLTTNQQRIDLGEVKFGEPREFEFIVKNSGDKLIKINSLVVGCQACTVATTKNVQLEANQSTPINIVFKPGSTGYQMKRVTIHYDETKTLELKFTATVNA